MRRDIAGDGDVFRQDIAFPAEHVGPVIDKALILELPDRPVRSAGEIGRLNGPLAIRDRVVRIGCVAVEGIVAGTSRRIKAELAARAEIQVLLGRPGFRRPGVPRAPDIAARFKGNGLGLLERASILEIEGKPRRLDLFSVVSGGGAAEPDSAEAVSFGAVPAAVIPWAHRQKVHLLLVVLFQGFVDPQRAVEILLIPPSGHV